jgi:site-specific DNA recombinase
MTTTSRAAIYARISRDQQGEGLGVQRQEQLCQELAQRIGASSTTVYTDNDISAYSGRTRPRYEQMLKDIQGGHIDLVLCYHSDRLMRRSRELERYIDICKPRGVVTHQVTAGVLDLSTATGLAVAKTVATWSQHESDQKAERIQAQKAQAAKAGKYLGGRVPFGWKKAGAVLDAQGHQRGGQIIVDEQAAALIRTGTASIILGRSLISVTRDWAATGAASLSGTFMNTTQVRRTLLRPRNAGLMTFHGEVVSDQWPAVVSLDQFRKCEAILTDQNRPKQAESKFKYLLTGVAKCHCGRTVTGFGVEAKRAYRCKVHQEGGTYVAGHIYRAMGPLDDYVRSMAIAYLGRKADVKALRQEIRRREQESMPVIQDDMAVLIARKHSLARLFAAGAISESQLVEGSREIEAMAKNLEDRAVASGSSRAVAAIVLTDDPAAAFRAAHVEQQRAFIREVFDVQLLKTGPSRGHFDSKTVSVKPL